MVARSLPGDLFEHLRRGPHVHVVVRRNAHLISRRLALGPYVPLHVPRAEQDDTFETVLG
eukprot:10405757-Alexandrium_andersonii.AAC.1